ncbi:MAG TPA: hypothetical protein VHY18_08495 [Solirubrobacteraceae bacterium]|jgi:hypothetical protein|nr:hypothetical protein [Solirubrobacteraceae bacterium]
MSGALDSWRSPLAALVAVSLVLGAGACGSASKRSPRDPTVLSGAGHLLGDEDGDSQGDSGSFDADDGPVRSFGHAAGAREAQAITTLVRSYYAAAATGSGAKACALLYYLVAESLPEDYGRPPGPLYLKGADSCPVLMSRVFAHFHTQLASPPTIVAVRVNGDRAYALLGWTDLPAGFIEARREGGSWRINVPLATPLP